jgi:hypothetical protein
MLPCLTTIPQSDHYHGRFLRRVEPLPCSSQPITITLKWRGCCSRARPTSTRQIRCSHCSCPKPMRLIPHSPDDLASAARADPASSFLFLFVLWSECLSFFALSPPPTPFLLSPYLLLSLFLILRSTPFAGCLCTL